jgi:myxalamid-type polyketide synthase MxaC
LAAVVPPPMASSAEAAAVRSGDLGGWLASLGLQQLLVPLEEVGAETPHDLVFLEGDDIDALSLTPNLRTVLTTAISRVESLDVSDDDDDKPQPNGDVPHPTTSAPAPAPAAAATATQHEHGHMLHLHQQEIEKERANTRIAQLKAESEARSRAAAEQRVKELEASLQASSSASDSKAANATLALERTQRQAEAQSQADAAAKKALEAKAERLAAALRQAEANQRASPAPVAAAKEQPGLATTTPMAVTGIGCRLPGSNSPAQFWANLEAGVDSVTVGPTGRWNVDDYFDPEGSPGKTYSHWGGFMDDVDLFEPAFFNISQRECHNMDPQHRVLLEVAWEAMEDGGVIPATLHEKSVGVFLGIQNMDYFRLIGTPGNFEELDAYFGSGNSHSCAVGRLSFVLGIKGPSVPVDTACSSSLVAMQLAVQSLRAGDCETAFCGGVNMMLAPEINVNLSAAHMLSADGRCHTYDASANGYVRGEGVGVTYLKPLPQAMADCDRIHALVIGASVNHDGHSSGLTVPNGPAQTMVIQAAQSNAGVRADDVSCIETHGTGTKLGDPIEINSLVNVFRGRDASKPLTVGTVKTNIGHLEAAAGIAGIMKAALALENGRIPKHLHLTKLNPHISFQDVPIVIPQETAPWPPMFSRRITGCSGFGFGGTNGHVVLENAPINPPQTAPEREWHVLPVSGKTMKSLKANISRLIAYLEQQSPILADVCYTALTRRTQYTLRAALTANSIGMLVQQLKTIDDSSITKVSNDRQKVAFVFPAEGGEYAGMGQQLYSTETAFRTAVDACCKFMSSQLDKPLLDVMFKGTGISQAQYAGPARFVYQYALAQLWLSWGLQPAVFVGYGMGEYVAACLAGVFGLEDAIKLLTMRSELLSNDPAWTMSSDMFGMLTNMVAFSAPQTPMVAATTGALVRAGDNSVVSKGDYWKDQARTKAQPSAGVQAALNCGAGVFVQVGPDSTFAAAGQTSLPEGSAWIATMQTGQPEGQCVMVCAAELVKCNVEIDASAVCQYDPATHSIVSLPTYSFDHKRFWIDVDRDVYAAPGATGSSVGGPQITPLLGTMVKLPMSEQVFHTRFGTNNLPLLGDHVLHDVVVVPGAAYIAFGLAASVHMHGKGPHRLHSVTFPQALVLPEAELGREVQLIFDTDEDETDFTLHSFDTHSETWVQHMTGSLSVRPRDAPDPMMSDNYLEDTLLRCNKGEMPCGKDPWCEELYDILWAREYHLRPMFRWLGHIWKGDREAVCKMRMPFDSSEVDDFELFPGLIDSCFQLLAATAFDEFQGTTFIPMWAGAYNYFGKPPPGTQLYCHAIERKNSEVATKDAMGADLWLFDEAGNKYVELINIRMKKAGVEALIHSAMEKPTNNQFFEVAWKKAPLTDSSAMETGTWMIVGDMTLPIVKSLSSFLSQRGNSITSVSFGSTYSAGPNFTVDPTQADHFSRVVAAAPTCVGVVHVGALGNVASLDPQSALPLTTQSGFFLSQALASAGSSSRLFFATLEAQKVGSSSVHDVNSSMLWGLARVMALEHPNMSCTIIDLEASDPAAASTLGMELISGDSELQVAFRGGRRVVGRLAKCNVPKVDGGDNPIKLQINGRGKLDNLSFQPFDRVPPKAGQVEVRVAVTGLNFRDVMNAMGMYPDAEKLNMPFGGECAGYVSAVGPGVTEFAVGDEVFGIGEGSFATYAISDVNYVVKKPAGISFEEATTIPATFLTAWYGLVNLAKIAAGKKVLVHAASGGVGLAAVQVCKGFGCEVFGTAKPGEKQDYLRANGVKYVMSSRDTAYGAAIAQATQSKGVDVVLNSLSGEGMIETSIDSLSPGGHFVEIGKAGIWTAEQVKAKRPDVHYHHFDLVQLWNDDPPFIKAMLGDLMGKFAKKEIQTLPVHSFPQAKSTDAFRFMANAKHIGKIVVQWDAPVTPVAFKEDACYLVTGGLSGVGLLTAKWMISKGAKNLVLASRSGATAKNVTERQELAELGANVEVVSLDASDAGGVARVISDLATRPAPLRGIIHSAGVVDDHLVTDLTWEQFTKVMAPKLQGAWNLHEASKSVPLDHFVLYSTMSAVVGNVGQSNYAAGNAFMDALCQQRSVHGLPALSVNWGPWAEVGMASRMDAAALKAIPDKAMIFPAEGMQLLEQLMSGSPSKAQVVVGAPTFLHTFASSSALMKDLVKELKPAASARKPTVSGGGGSALQDSLQSAPESQRMDILVEFISGEVAKILALDGASDVDPKQPLTEMGLDSLMAVELRNALADAVATPLPATLLFDYPMVTAIAEFLMKEVLSFDDAGGAPKATMAPTTKKKKRAKSDDEPVAIVGMSCRFPSGGNSVETFWENLVAAKDCVTLIPKRRWDWKEYYHANMDAPGKTYSKWAATLSEDADLFDPFFFGIVPKEASGMDPQQRQLVEVAWETMERSGHHLEPSKGSPIGVFIGICSNDYQMAQTATGDKELCDAYYGTGNANSVAAGRIAYILGFQGPTISVDTACSSSLVAAHLALSGLRSDECDMALAGGVNMLLTPDLSINFSKAHMLSPDGRCFTFDARANGYVRGEGCAMLLLRSLSDAQDSGDNVVAMIRGSAINQDGRSSGITAPNGPSQQNCIRAALVRGGVSAADVGYLEAHGTGTPLGDPIEVDAMAAVFGKEGNFHLGSVKTNVGHLEGSAGMSGLCKLILATHHAILPAHLHFKTENPHLSLSAAKATLPLETIPWPTSAGPRIGGVSSFGFSGTNGHMVVEQPPKARSTADYDISSHVFTMSAKTVNALQELASAYAAHFESNPTTRLSDVCFTAAVGRSAMPHRVAISASSISELEKQLRLYAAGEESKVSQGFVEEKVAPKAAFVFPGQGTAMGEQLYATDPTFREHIDACDKITDVKSALFGSNGIFVDGSALFACEYAMAQMWMSWGIKPAVVMGSGVGEFVAACVAGIFSLEDGLKLVTAHAEAVSSASTIKIVNVSANEAAITQTVQAAAGVTIMGTSGPSTTIVGSVGAVDAVIATLTSQGVSCAPVPTPAEFVSPSSATSATVQQIAASTSYSVPRISFVANATGEIAPPSTVGSAEYWSEHSRPTVQFSASLKTAYTAKCRIFLEVGTQGTAMALASRVLDEQTALTLPSLCTGHDEWSSMSTTLAQLFVRGAALDWTSFYSSRPGSRVVLPTYPYQKQRFWVSGLGGSLAATSEEHAEQSVSYAVAPINKALGRLVSTPFASDTIFLSHFSIDTMPVIEDHIINGFLIVPAVFDIGMVLEAHKYLLGPGSRVIEGVQIPAALVLNDIATKPTQLVITESGDSHMDWQLYSYKSGDPEDPNSWLGNASGKFTTDTTQTSRKHERIEEIQARCTVEQNKFDFYTYMFKNEYELGGPCVGDHKSGIGNGFQLVDYIWRTEGEALCKLVVEPQSVRGEFEFYPVYFDCCIQIIASIVSSLVGEESVSYVPIAIEKFILHEVPAHDCQIYCHTVLVDDGRDAPGDWLAKDTIPAMMCVMDAEGTVMAEAINFRVKRAGKELLAASLKEDLSHFYHNLDWTPLAMEGSPSAEDTGSWIVLADDTLSNDITAKLLADGQTVVTVKPGAAFDVQGMTVTVRPDHAEDFTQLLAHNLWSAVPACVGVVHMWSLQNSTVSDPTATELEAATRVGTHSALLLCQAIATWAATPRVWLVTRGTQEAPGDTEGLAFAQSPLFGFGKVIALEQPKMQCVRIDLGLNSGDNESQHLYNELLSPSSEQEVALRGDERFVSRIVQRPKDKSSQITLNPEASYLVTGGFGALGLLVAKMLAQRGAKHLILVSRRGAPEGSEEALEELAELGATVTPGKADASKEDQMRALFATAEASGHPVAGCVHSAGVIDDKMLADLDWASFEKVMAAKVAGARNLHMLMQDPEHDFLVLFSSATSAIGNVGQANYAAANMFLDSLARHRRMRGLPGLSINWGPWSEVGMAAALDAATFEAGGLGLIAPKQGIEILEQCMVQNSHAQIVIAPVTWATYLGRMGKNVPALFTVMQEAAKKDGGGGGGGGKAKKKKKGATGGSATADALIKKLLAIPEAKRQPVLSTMIQSAVMEVLGVTDPSAVGFKQALSEVGMDSLMAVDVQNVLADMVGSALPGTLLFDYPTVDALSTYFLDEVLDLADDDEGGGGGMSQEQLDKMRGEPVAIVGTSCRMPGGGQDPELFWTKLSSGNILTSRVPKDRWDHDVLYDTDQDIPGKVYTDQGGFLDFNPAWFDASFFGISNREAEHMDPQQRMVLEVAWEAMESAGVNPETLVNSRTGVNIGVCGYDYCLLGTRTNDPAGIVGYTGTGVAWSVLAGRTSYTFGFKGPAFAVDTACSSGLIATHLACNDLKSGVTNNAVAGGVNLLLAPDLYVNFSKAHMLSPNGRCATFDEKADGFCRAEGCSLLFIKRLSDAEKANDRVLGLIRGTSTNQDGRSNSLTAPNGPSQQAVITESLMAADVQPNQVSYMECHGTGTSLGDPIEVIALGNVLGKDRPKDGPPLIIGSVKAACGHLEGAAGSSGLAKILMCMKYEMIPAQVHYFKMNPMINIDQIPGTIPLGKQDYRDYQGKGYGEECTPWKTADNRLIADVSSFGFGGSNAHATLEKYRPQPLAPSAIERPIHVLPLSATSTEALTDLASKFVTYCNGDSTTEELQHACFTAGTGRQHFPVRLALPCETLADASVALQTFVDGRSTAAVSTGTVAGDTGVVMMFTGQGSQYADMGKELYDTQPVFKENIDECAKLLKPHMDKPLLSVLFPKSGEISPIDLTVYTQPCLFAFEYSLAQLWSSWGVEAAAVVGHSVGEYVAACVAGVMSLEDGLKLIATRARLMDSLPREGTMAAVFEAASVVVDAIASQPDVAIAAVNGPKLVVISGRKDGVEAILSSFASRGVRCKELNTSNAFHSSVMDPILDEFEKVASSVTYGEPYTDIILNRTGKPADATSKIDAAYWRDHLRNSVLFSDSVEFLYNSGKRIFLEIGPQPVLLGMARRVVPDDSVKWVPSIKQSSGDWKSITKSISDLYVAGASLNWAGFDQPYARKKVQLPSYAFQEKFLWPKRMVIGQEMINNEVVNQSGVSGARPTPKAAPAIHFDQIWRKLDAANAGQAAGPWLVLADQQGLASSLQQQASAAGVSVTLMPKPMDSLSVEQFAQSFTTCAHSAGGPFSVVIDLWALDLTGTGAVAQDTLSACGHILHLLKTVTQQDMSPKIWFVTKGAQPVTPSELEVVQAPVWGLARVVSLEHPDMWGGLIDLDPAVTAANQATQLFAEVTSSSTEDHVGLRSGSRYGLRVAESPALPQQVASFKADATYLVTGGLGGVLQQIVQWMVAQGAKHLVLTSRRGLPADPEAASVKFVRELEAKGAKIDVVAVDVCNLRAMRASLSGMRIAGIVHGAGVMSAETLATLSVPELQKVLQPKVEGSWNLHTLAQEMDLEFFVMFSSISAVWGSNQLAHYAAANIFCDALAHHRRALGLTALSVDWGLLAEGGMSAHENAKFSAAMGLRALTVEEYTGTMGQLIAAGSTQKVAVGIDWSKFKDIYDMRGPKPLLAEVGGAASGGSNRSGQSSLLKVTFAGLEGEEFSAKIADLVRGAVRDTVGEIEIAFDAPLMESGMDSMMAVDFRNALQERLGGLKLSQTLMFDYPTLGKVAEYIESQVKAVEFTDAPEVTPIAQVQRPTTSGDSSVVIVGMAGCFPDAPSTSAFWDLLCTGKDAIREIPWERFDVDEFFDADPNAVGNKIYVREGGFIANADAFDPRFFDISSAEAYLMDPQQRLLLDVGATALYDAGFVKKSLQEANVGVYCGIGSPDFRDISARDQATVGAFSATGSAMCICANRISYTFGLKGPSVALDTACSSALTAMTLGYESLLQNNCDAALAEGVNLLLSPTTFVATCKARMLSPDSRCRTFDATANGYVRGEGCGAVVMVRQSDVTATQKVLATVRAASLNQDGRTASLTAPNGPSQQGVINKALGQAGLAGADIDYVETHGTGTPLGDPIEIGALKEVLGAGRNKKLPLLLGAVKTNIGHLEAAAGIASVVKTCLLLQNKVVPPNLHFTKLNPAIDADGFPVNFAPQMAPLLENSTAGVSSFGFGGTNAHIILQGADTDSTKQNALPIYDRSLFRWGDVNHPLVGVCPKQTSKDGLQEWTTTWDLKTVETLCGHRVGRVSLVPATCYIEMVTPIVRQIYGDVPFSLRDLQFVNILYLALDKFPTVKISLQDGQAIRIESLTESTGQWNLHATMNLQLDEATEHPKLDIEAMKARCSEVRSGGDDFYDGIGNDYQGHFRSVSKIFLGDDELMCCVELDPEPLQGRSDLCAMAWLDACTQAGVVRMDHQGRPFYASKAGVYAVGGTDRRLQSRLWSVMKQATPGGRKGRIDIYNDLGEWLVSIVGNEAGFFERGHEPTASSTECMYESQWELVEPSAGLMADEWVVVAETAAAAQPYCVALQQELGGAVKVCTDVVQGVASASPSATIVCVAALQPGGGDKVDVVELVRTVTLAATGSQKIWIVTRGTQTVRHSSLSATAQAMSWSDVQHSGLWGFARSARAEGFSVRCLDAAGSCTTASDVARQVAACCAAPESEMEVAVRAGQLFVPRLAKADVKLSGPVELFMPERGALATLVMRPLSASTRRTPGPGEVELRVRAVGLNFRDVLNAMGLYPGAEAGPVTAETYQRPGDPGPLGGDCAGIITAVGEGVEHLTVGDQAFGIQGGCLKGYVTGPALLLEQKPQTMTFAEAASMPIIWLTVELCFSDPFNPGIQSVFNLKRGESVLIHAATGGVGLVAVAYAMRVGATVYATAGRKEKHDHLRAMGVQYVTSSRDVQQFKADMTTWTGGTRIDVCLNSLADDFIPESLALLKQGGRFMEIGKRTIWSKEQMKAVRPDVLYEPIAADVMLTTDPAWFNRQMQRMVQQVDDGIVAPIPHKAFDLESSGVEALRFLQQAQHIGKVVATSPSTMGLMNDMVYVITGGMGALGLSMARRMIEEGACNLVLLSRSGKPSAALKPQWDILQESSANVLSRKCDVSNKASIKKVLTQLKNSGIIVKGVLHAAGVLDDAALANMSREKIQGVYGAKVEGAWNLHEITASLGMELDFFVLFSSISALLGSTAQVMPCFLSPAWPRSV